MASPVADSYSGNTALNCGRFSILNTVALVGDSLTENQIGYNLSPFHVANGMTGGKFQLIGNIGVSGEEVALVLARIDNQYSNIHPGLGGLAPLGWIELRIGTNDARAGAFNSTIQGQYDALLAKLLTYATKVIVKPVPPLGGSYTANNAYVPAYNAYLQGKCAASGGALIWIDDCVNVKDGSGNQISAFFSDGIHFTTKGVWQLATDTATALAAAIAQVNYASPISTDAADKYPAQPQWVPNLVNAGTSGSSGGGITGVVANNWSLWGGGGSTGIASVVAADAGDANQTPWQRFTPTSMVGGSSCTLATSLSGRAISASVPTTFEQVLQIRLNALDTNIINDIKSYIQGLSGNSLTYDLDVKMGGGVYSQVLTMRSNMPRRTLLSDTGATLYIDIHAIASSSSALGSVDFRCITVRG